MRRIRSIWIWAFRVQRGFSRWETGQIQPGIDDLLKTSEATGRPVSCALGLIDEHGVPLRAERIADELEAKVDELMRKASLRTLTPLQADLVEPTRGSIPAH